MGKYIPMEKDEVIYELLEVYNKNGKINKNLIYEHGKTIGKPLYQRMISYFDNIENMYSELNLKKTKRGCKKKAVNADYLLNAIDKCYNENAYVTRQLVLSYVYFEDYNIKKRLKNQDIDNFLLKKGFKNKRFNNKIIWTKNCLNILNKNQLNNIIININNKFNVITKQKIEIINNLLLDYIDKYYNSFDNMIKTINLSVIDKIDIDKEMNRIFELARIKNTKITLRFIRFNFKYDIKYFNQYVGIKNKDIIEYNKNFNITKDMVDNDIINIYNMSILNNEKFNIRYYRKNTKYSWYLENKFYDSFQDAVNKLNLKSNILPKCDLDNIKKEIIDLYNKYGFFSVELFRNKNSLKNKSAKYVYDNIDGGFTTLCSQLNVPLNNGNKSCKFLIDIIEEILNEKAKREYSFEWLRNSNNNKYRVDAYFEKFNLIVEYNGKQHYEQVNIFHNTIDEFNKYVNDYNDKIAKLKQKNFIILEWKYNKSISYESVKKELMKLIKL